MTQERGASSLTLVLIRGLDLLLSLTALTAFSPLLVLVAIALRLSGEGEIFYRQVRIGKGGQEFTILKFATMMKNSPVTGSGELTLPNDPRVLPLGRFLRRTKLNELPQLINVVAGELSLIGPRPQTRRYYCRYGAADRAWIDTVRPGLSGVGSILFRDEEALLATVADPVAFDDQIITPYKGEVERWFAVNQSVALYIELVITTALVVLWPSLRLHQRLLRRVPEPSAALKKLLEN